jgi:hypothetical protein
MTQSWSLILLDFRQRSPTARFSIKLRRVDCAQRFIRSLTFPALFSVFFDSRRQISGAVLCRPEGQPGDFPLGSTAETGVPTRAKFSPSGRITLPGSVDQEPEAFATANGNHSPPDARGKVPIR